MLEYPTEVAFLHALRRVVPAVGGPPLSYPSHATPHSRERGPAWFTSIGSPSRTGRAQSSPLRATDEGAAGQCIQAIAMASRPLAVQTPPLTSNAATGFSESDMSQVYVGCVRPGPGPGRALPGGGSQSQARWRPGRGLKRALLSDWGHRAPGMPPAWPSPARGTPRPGPASARVGPH